MNAWLARTIDLMVAWALVRPQITRYRFRTDPTALAELVADHRGRPISDWLPSLLAPPSGPVRVEPLRPRSYGAAYDVSFRSALPSGDANNDLVRARLVLPPGHEPIRDWSAGTAVGLGPTLILVPGWMTLSVREYEHAIGRVALAAGANVLVLETPWHHRRTPSGYESGVLALSGDLVRSARMLAQAMADVGSLVGWARSVGSPAVGAWGESLGGWIVSLLGSATAELDLLVPAVPPVRILRVLSRSPLLPPVRRDLRASRVPAALLAEAAAMLSPLSHQLMVPRERVLLFEAAYEMLLPDEGVSALWEHWGRPERIVLPEGHISIRFSVGFREGLAAAVRRCLVAKA